MPCGRFRINGWFLSYGSLRADLTRPWRPKRTPAGRAHRDPSHREPSPATVNEPARAARRSDRTHRGGHRFEGARCQSGHHGGRRVSANARHARLETSLYRPSSAPELWSRAQRDESHGASTRTNPCGITVTEASSTARSRCSPRPLARLAMRPQPGTRRHCEPTALRRVRRRMARCGRSTGDAACLDT